VKDKVYIESKLRHLKRCGVTADIDPENGAVRPEWVKQEQEERAKRFKLSQSHSNSLSHLTATITENTL
jgi:hypothetical protein